jgi:ornithine cyclodeaminase/alanine dehydrogenase
MTVILKDSEVRDLADMDALIDCIEDGYRVEARGGAKLPDRVNLEGAAGFFRLMPAVIPGCGVMGVKVFNMSSTGVQYVIGLWDEQSGALLALVDSAYLTAARTGATTAVAAKYLAPSDTTQIGVIGSGLEAETNLDAVCRVLPIERVTVFSPNAERRDKFAATTSKRLDVEVVAVDDPLEAAQSNVVIVATFTGIGTNKVALSGEWLEPGACVLSIGSTAPALRELDTSVVARAGAVVIDAPDQARLESGDLIAADDEGLLDGRVLSLAALVEAGGAQVPDDGSIRLFKSVGTGLQDLLAAKAIYDSAMTTGTGTHLEFPEGKARTGR